MRSARSRIALALGLVAGAIALTLTGCSGSPTADESSSSADSHPPFLIDQDFPDPDLLTVDDTTYAYATNSRAVNIQFATSKNLKTWDVSTDDALPTLPAWASAGRTWAPDVSAAPGGGYVMYFVAEQTASGKQCIGVSTAADPKGPFTPAAGGPIVCTLDDGGAIDPATFTDDDGTRYLVWKNDGNCCGLDTWIQLAPLSSDGLSLAGPATRLFKQTESWEGNLVEAPTLIKHGSTYLVFYSANDYGSDKYAVGVASAPALLGPYTKMPKPLLSSSDGGYYGPGGQDVLHTEKGDLLFFHSWDDNVVYRGMSVAPIAWSGDTPSVPQR
ncbi:glycoside hydrolase family 43 protein [Glaciibacter flavus]|uniref:glycoside hydrolase family 43 protein n=1 Tax=Orlajensenia flava TaxID=2565934 RepID=UPI003B003911